MPENPQILGCRFLDALVFTVLTFHGRVPKKHPKNVSWEKSICKSSLISWVISVQ